MSESVAEFVEIAPQILIIEDEPDVAKTLKRVVESCGAYEISIQTDPLKAIESIVSNPPDLIFTDS